MRGWAGSFDQLMIWERELMFYDFTHGKFYGLVLKRTVQYTRSRYTSAQSNRTFFNVHQLLFFSERYKTARQIICPSGVLLRAFRCNFPPSILRASHRDSCPHSAAHSDCQLPTPSILFSPHHSKKICSSWESGR